VAAVIRLGPLLLLSAALPGLALPPPALAQPAPAPAALPDPALPPDPAAAPPPPARLEDAPRPVPPPPPRAAPPPLPGLESLPEGAWRLRFPPGSEAPPPAAATALATLGRRLAERPQGRFTLEAQASGPEADVSLARRLSLARGLAVKEALAAGGLPPTRIDVRPLGRTEEALDVVDILPPEARRSAR
jgi:outer membrane protein OmpA-like peptidoglycan-associated protein